MVYDQNLPCHFEPWRHTTKVCASALSILTAQCVFWIGIMGNQNLRFLQYVVPDTACQPQARNQRIYRSTRQPRDSSGTSSPLGILEYDQNTDGYIPGKGRLLKFKCLNIQISPQSLLAFCKQSIDNSWGQPGDTGRTRKHRLSHLISFSYCQTQSSCNVLSAHLCLWLLSLLACHHDMFGIQVAKLFDYFISLLYTF